MVQQLEFVKATRSGFIFPSNIPEKRGNNATIATVLANVTCVIISGILKNESYNVISLAKYSVIFVSFNTLLLVLVEILNRLCMAFEEYFHLRSRYDSSRKNLFQNLFSFTPHVLISIIASLIVMYFIVDKWSPEILFNEKNCIFLLVAMFLYHRLIHLQQSPVYTSMLIENSSGLDYGSGMAHSFFHGYLRIILQKTGIENDKNLREFLEDYEDHNQIKFSAYKLFILIPFSQHCPPRLASEFSPSVEDSMELESKNIDRAGVSKRNYKNSVYKITSRSKKLYYVSAEYATPVKTLHEVMKQNTRCANSYKQNRKELLYNFYTTLVGLVNDDPDCQDLCDIIYYDDMDDKGNYHDVGGIILKRLKSLGRRL